MFSPKPRGEMAMTTSYQWSILEIQKPEMYLHVYTTKNCSYLSKYLNFVS
jgi:hypothetical protein